jgi:hypothetical protein
VSKEAERTLALADEYPYDATDEDGGSAPKGDWATRAARGVIGGLSGRKGIDHALHDVDHEIRVEIVETVAGIIRTAYEEEQQEHQGGDFRS